MEYTDFLSDIGSVSCVLAFPALAGPRTESQKYALWDFYNCHLDCNHCLGVAIQQYWTQPPPHFNHPFVFEYDFLPVSRNKNGLSDLSSALDSVVDRFVHYIQTATSCSR